MSLADATREALGWDLIAKAVATQRQAARDRLLAEMEAAQSLKQGEPGWGTATLSGGDPTAEIYDLDALTAWTAQNRPEMMVPTVRPKWLELLKQITVEMGRPIDPETGALVPGIRRVTKPHTLYVRTTREAQDAARALVSEMAIGSLKVVPKEEIDSV